MKRIFLLDNESYGQVSPKGEPLKVRRLDQFGRIVLYQIINDPPPYWFVMIKNFDPTRDAAPGLSGDRQKLLIDPDKIPTWRFLDLECAKLKFAQLSILPWCVTDEVNRQKLREKSRQRILLHRKPLPAELKKAGHVKTKQ